MSVRPFGPQLDQGVVEIHADAAAHAHHHRFAVHRLQTLFEVRHQVGSHEREALGIAHQRFNGGPLGFQLFLLRELFAFGDLLELRIEPGQLGGIEGQLGDAAFVVDRHGGLVGHGALDVVDGDVVAEHRPGVGVGLLDRRAGEADEGGVGEGIAQVAGEAVGDLAGLFVELAAEAVLAAVRFIGDHDDVLPGAQLGHRFAPVGHELLDGGEHHTAAGAVEQVAQLLAIGGLHRGLAEDVGAALELAEELVVEIVAIGEHHQGGVLQCRMAHDARGIEEHREALATALGVPHHAGAAVARSAALAAGCRAEPAGTHGFLHRRIHGMELVIAGDDLVQGARIRVFLEDDEVLQQIEEALRREHPPDERLQLQGGGRCVGLAIDAAPQLEPLLVGGDRADAGLQAVAHHQGGVELKERRESRPCRSAAGRRRSRWWRLQRRRS